MTENRNLVRIAFDLDGAESGGIARERLWAKALGDGTYELENSPFHVYGVSYKDVVSALLDNDDQLISTGVVRRGGHSTYRVKLPIGKGDGYFLEFWPRLGQMGCTYEVAAGRRRLYAIDIPPGISVHAVYSILESLEAAGVWEFEEGHYFSQSPHEPPTAS